MTGAEFKNLRLLAGLTQEQTAHLLGKTHRTILRWESGDSRIDDLSSETIRARLIHAKFYPHKRSNGESLT